MGPLEKSRDCSELEAGAVTFWKDPPCEPLGGMDDVLRI